MEAIATQMLDHITLRGVAWTTYEALLCDFQSRSVPHFTYDQGTLEIMSPTPKHDMWNRLLSSLIEAVAETWEIDLANYGSTTFRRADLEAGFEPDSCFYVQNGLKMTGREEIDIDAGDPPPDLVIEVDVFHASIPKMPLFARMSIPEVWRIDKLGQIHFYALEEQTYIPVETSRAFPLISANEVNRLMLDGRNSPRVAWLRRVRQWARDAAANAG